jgi:hypothetical protein
MQLRLRLRGEYWCDPWSNLKIKKKTFSNIAVWFPKVKIGVGLDENNLQLFQIL